MEDVLVAAAEVSVGTGGTHDATIRLAVTCTDGVAELVVPGHAVAACGTAFPRGSTSWSTQAAVPNTFPSTDWWMIWRMAGTQSDDLVLDLLNRLRGETVAELQVMGVNSLKSVTPPLSDLVGLEITGVSVSERLVTIGMGSCTATIDLQRTGRLQWLDHAEPAQIGRPGLPTLRLLLRSGAGLDFSEPAKTKRIAVTICAD